MAVRLLKGLNGVAQHQQAGIEMYRRKLNKKNLAALLEFSALRLCDVLQGRRVNLDLAKRLNKRLGISADFILEVA